MQNITSGNGVSQSKVLMLDENDPKFKRAKKFVKKASPQYYDIVVTHVFEIKDGEYIINCYGTNNFPGTENDLVYHICSLDDREGNFTTKSFYRNAMFTLLTETLGMVRFDLEFTPLYLKKCLYNFNSDMPEKLYFTEIESFDFTAAYSINTARVTISISYSRDLVFLIDESGNIISPICDTKLAYVEGDANKSYIRPKGHQSFADFVSGIVDEENGLQRVISSAKDALYQRIIK